MSDTSVAADLGQSLDIEFDFSFEIAFDAQVVVDVLTDLSYLVFRQIPDSGIGIDPGSRKDLVGSDISTLFSRGKSTPAIRAIKIPPNILFVLDDPGKQTARIQVE